MPDEVLDLGLIFRFGFSCAKLEFPAKAQPLKLGFLFSDLGAASAPRFRRPPIAIEDIFEIRLAAPPADSHHPPARAVTNDDGMCLRVSQPFPRTRFPRAVWQNCAVEEFFPAPVGRVCNLRFIPKHHRPLLCHSPSTHSCRLSGLPAI